MPSYFSEVAFHGGRGEEFIEIAVPADTDVTAHAVIVYDADGQLEKTVSIGIYGTRLNGHDIYVLDERDEDLFAAGHGGILRETCAIALVDGDETVLSFISWQGHRIEAVDGPAKHMVAHEIGSLERGQHASLYTENQGLSYQVQEASDFGPTMACYAPGTMILTPEGKKPIEDLRAGDLVSTADGDPVRIQLAWSGPAGPDGTGGDLRAVRFEKGSLGWNLPHEPLLVSEQHRVVLGGWGQLPHCADQPILAPVASMASLAGVRYLSAEYVEHWHHILCSRHALIIANGAVSETLLPGAVFMSCLTRAERRRANALKMQRNALPSVTTSQAKELLSQVTTPQVQAKPVLVAQSTQHLEQFAAM